MCIALNDLGRSIVHIVGVVCLVCVVDGRFLLLLWSCRLALRLTFSMLLGWLPRRHRLVDKCICFLSEGLALLLLLWSSCCRLALRHALLVSLVRFD
ncbi:hypothetical protein GMOD_00006100 [Pyrenophora seminiperda CCB06]|uniref:Uncharacterized protein n=1 Tax=Pyrenophora seminiperda CCB06 TaxID=1302712 RepID=A0A3M7M4C2_9PLEO|nr:hypothetical protein GMOD_00006100 [Pyrenophora seminiperda CCB06]